MPYIKSSDPWSPDEGEVPYGECPICFGDTYFGDVDADEDGTHVTCSPCGGVCDCCGEEVCNEDTDMRNWCSKCVKEEAIILEKEKADAQA